MARLSYEIANTLVYDPVPANRTASRAVLFTIGFRNIETIGTIDALLDAFRNRPPDLALCEVQGAEGELCDMIQALRQGANGYNPFMIIIVTAWEKTNSLVSRVLNSGADDLLLRPFSTTLLRMRIDTHVERRKGFVITHEYVGPDRRNDPARASQVDLFVPPNSLKMKAKDKMTPEEASIRLDIELKSARDVLNSEKLRRDAFQMCILWRLIQDATPAEETAHLAKLDALTKAVVKRSRETEFTNVSKWCDSVKAGIEGLMLGVDRNASMHLLGHATLNLYQVFHPQSSTAENVTKVEATVAMIKARMRASARKAEPLKTVNGD
jgi:DNA-binding response OmpR family regulator